MHVTDLADFVALDRDILDEVAVPDAQIWQTAILATYTGGVPAWQHPCWLQRGHKPTPSQLSAVSAAVTRSSTHGFHPAGNIARQGLAAMRTCVEAERAASPPAESLLERLQRLSAAHGDGCPF